MSIDEIIEYVPKRTGKVAMRESFSKSDEALPKNNSNNRETTMSGIGDECAWECGKNSQAPPGLRTWVKGTIHSQRDREKFQFAVGIFTVISKSGNREIEIGTDLERVSPPSGWSFPCVQSQKFPH